MNHFANIRISNDYKLRTFKRLKQCKPAKFRMELLCTLIEITFECRLSWVKLCKCSLIPQICSAMFRYFQYPNAKTNQPLLHSISPDTMCLNCISISSGFRGKRVLKSQTSPVKTPVVKALNMIHLNTRKANACLLPPIIILSM